MTMQTLVAQLEAYAPESLEENVVYVQILHLAQHISNPLELGRTRVLQRQ